jgi:Mycothiol maleylpyruvate isomerase N-terminal domain
MTLLGRDSPARHDRYCDENEKRIQQLRAVVTSGADLSATVPTCPDWSLEQPVRHIGGALRRVEPTVRGRAREEVPGERELLEFWLERATFG